MSNSNMKDRIQFLMRGGVVTRFHCYTCIKPNTDAAHQHGTAMLCYLLSDSLPSLNLIMAALTHDAAEWVIGDVPAPTKWSVPGLADTLDELEDTQLSAHDLLFPLTPDERRKLKLADLLDGILYCAIERNMGNKALNGVVAKWEERLPEVASPAEQEVITAILTLWREASA